MNRQVLRSIVMRFGRMRTAVSNLLPGPRHLRHLRRICAGLAAVALSAPVVPEVPARDVDLVHVDKSARTLTLISQGQPVRRYTGIQLGDAPGGHKRFQGDERTPEGRYTIDFGNPQSAYRLSLHIDYPNAADRAYAKARGRSPGGDIFIHWQPNWLPLGRVPGDWTDGCIALSDSEIEELWALVGDGTAIQIDP